MEYILTPDQIRAMKWEEALLKHVTALRELEKKLYKDTMNYRVEDLNELSILIDQLESFYQY